MFTLARILLLRLRYPLYTDILKVLKTGGLKFKVIEDTVTSKVRLRVGSGHFIIEIE